MASKISGILSESVSLLAVLGHALQTGEKILIKIQNVFIFNVNFSDIKLISNYIHIIINTYFGTTPIISNICKIMEIHKKNTIEKSNWHQWSFKYGTSPWYCFCYCKNKFNHIFSKFNCINIIILNNLKAKEKHRAPQYPQKSSTNV